MNNRCGSAKLLVGAMTRMSNKLVYHFLRFNEPPAGVNRRGATLARFLSSEHCIYGRGSRRVKTLEAAPDLIRQVTLFVDRFSRRVYELPLLADPCLGAEEQIYNVFSAGCTSCHVSPPPVQHNRDVLAAEEGADCSRVFIYNIHPCYSRLLQGVVHPILRLLTETACAL